MCKLLFKKIKNNKYIFVGILGALIAFIGGATYWAITLPWIGNADAYSHLDYAWQVSHGELPVYDEGMKAPLDKNILPVQFVAQHPPLYYAILAPFVGKALDEGHIVRAVASARVVTIALSSIMIGSYLHKETGSRFFSKWILFGFLKCLFVLLITFGGTSWFYIRNFNLSSSWYKGGISDWVRVSQNRKYKSFTEVIQSRALRYQITDKLYGNSWGNMEKIMNISINVFFSRLLLIASAISSAVTLVKSKFWKSIKIENIVILMLLIINVILVFSEQIAHATGYGAYNIRYLLPLWLPLGLLLAFGLGNNRKWRGVGIILGTTLNWGFVISHMLYSLNIKIVPIQNFDNILLYLKYIVVEIHDLPLIFLFIPLLLPIGLLLMGGSLWRLTDGSKSKLG